LLRLAPSASSWRACAKSPRGLARAAQRIAQKRSAFAHGVACEIAALPDKARARNAIAHG
ncbi:MAG: hypothetical protein ACTTKK_05220, partial [Ottowia sp.]